MLTYPRDRPVTSSIGSMALKRSGSGAYHGGYLKRATSRTSTESLSAS